MQTVSFMQTVRAFPLLWIDREKLKEIKLKILAFLNVLGAITEFVYANTIILFNLDEYWLRMLVNILSLFTSILENNC